MYDNLTPTEHAVVLVIYITMLVFLIGMVILQIKWMVENKRRKLNKKEK